MNPHRRTLLTSLALILPVIAQPAIAQQPTAESKPASKPKPKAKAKAEPAPPPPPAMPKEEVLATVKHTIAWANGQVYTAKLARGNIAMQRRIDAREPAGSEGEAPTQIRDEQARLERVEAELKDKRKSLRALATSDAQRLRVDEWYLSVKVALYDGSAEVVRTMESESDRIQLAFED